MKPLKRAQYPKRLMIVDEEYRIRFCNRFIGDKKHRITLGLTDSATKEIWLRNGLTDAQRMKTLIHEVLHALFEFEGGLKVRHKDIYRYEKLIYRFLRDNF